jgi:hypothetical protein
MLATTWVNVARSGQHNSQPAHSPNTPKFFGSQRPSDLKTLGSSFQPRQLAPLRSNHSPTQRFPTSSDRSTTYVQSSSDQEILVVQEPSNTPPSPVAPTHHQTASVPQISPIEGLPAFRTYHQIAARPEGSPVHASAENEFGKKASKKRLTKLDDDGNPIVKKRKVALDEDGNPIVKKPKSDKTVKAKREPKPKALKEKKEPAKYQLTQDIWMRILEFTPPAFLAKTRLVSKIFKTYVDNFSSIYKNCRKENFGYNMPDAPLGYSERQYNNLLCGSKGCLEPDCPDKLASRTHWSWGKRWCQSCWKSKIEREDKVFKNRTIHARPTLVKILECIPVGMHDSFMKPHDYVDDEVRPRGAPRLYKYYLTEDIEALMKAYDALTPAPYVEDPTHSAAEKAAAAAAHQALMDGLEAKRTEFFAAEKAKNDKHMDTVRKIEAGIRMRREKIAGPNEANRKSRKALFTKRAREDLFSSNPGMDECFVKSTKAFKNATRIFRDGGTERGWQALKPKILQEWQNKGKGTHTDGRNGEENLHGGEMSRLGSVMGDDDIDDEQSGGYRTPTPDPMDFEASQSEQSNNQGNYSQQSQDVSETSNTQNFWNSLGPRRVPSLPPMGIGSHTGTGLPPMTNQMANNGSSLNSTVSHLTYSQMELHGSSMVSNDSRSTLLHMQHGFPPTYSQHFAASIPNAFCRQTGGFSINIPQYTGFPATTAISNHGLRISCENETRRVSISSLLTEEPRLSNSRNNNSSSSSTHANSYQLHQYQSFQSNGHAAYGSSSR